LLAASVAAQTLYFYPPDDGKWIAGRSYISQGTAASAQALVLEPSKCGWYKATIPSSGTLRNIAQFWLGKSGMDRIGPKGRMAVDFDSPAEFENTSGNTFNLGQIAQRLGSGSIYFVADELDASDPYSGWYDSDPGYDDKSRCQFELAAFIYDTDPAVHPDFSCGIWKQGAEEGNGIETKAQCEENPAAITLGGNKKPTCMGVIQGLAASTLGEDRKIKCGNCTKNGCWTNEDWFDKAFTPTRGVNVERCYNMPFNQIKSGTGGGSFEFDSDKMQNASGRLVGGFFPDVLNSAPTDPNCPSCNTKRTADRFIPRISALTKEMFDAYQSQPGDFADGDTPKRSAFGLTPASEPIYDWGARPDNATATGGATWTPWYLHGTTAMKTYYGAPQATYDANAKANQHFCFESHADFYYDPEQVFYFSGDDDIWVYINRKLVIDLGGAHLAAPAHVELKNLGLGLEEGNLYPIDIFFCNRRTPMSDVRISTNIYAVQKSGFWSKSPSAREQMMCAAVSGGSDCASKMSGSISPEGCGTQLIDAHFKVEYYMIARGNTRDTIWLSPIKNRPRCTGTDNNFTCFGGIKNQDAVYSCGGAHQCKSNPDATKRVDLSGNFNVYARLLNPSGRVAGTILIDNIVSQTSTRIVWGHITPWEGSSAPAKDLKDSYGNITTREQSIIAGRRTPIYISDGIWDDESSYNSFSYDDSSSTAFTVSIVSGGNGLKIYESETGGTGSISYSGGLSSGLATLWVEGSYDIGEKEFELNVTSERSSSPNLKIKVYQPELRFVESDGKTIIGSNGSGWTRWQTITKDDQGREERKPPFVGSALDVYLFAWDKNRNELCGSCNFSLKQTSTTNNSDINKKWGDAIVTSDASGITNGKADILLSGNDAVTEQNFAEWEVWGPSREQTSAKWTQLQFRTSPVPMPIKSYIFDRNGDGIGDSLVVEFNKALFNVNNGMVQDSSFPLLLEVVWAAGDTIRFHPDIPGHSLSDLKNKAKVLELYKSGRAFFDRNRDYWLRKIKGANIICVTSEDVGGRGFSSKILTTGFNDGKGVLSSYTPFYEMDLCLAGVCNDNAFQYNTEGSKTAILDRIPPIVVKAEYNYVSNNGKYCLDEVGCKEEFKVTFSEPVFKGKDISDIDLIKNPFQYCFGRSQGTNCPVNDIDYYERHNQNWSNVYWDWENPKNEDYSNSAIYKPNTKGLNQMSDPGANGGDEYVEMVYYSRKLNVDKLNRTPKADDWVKLRTDHKVFQDAEGNVANPRERGVIITGTSPSKNRPNNSEQAIIDPNAPVLGGTFTGERDDDYYPSWISEATRDYANSNLYKPGIVAEFLPVPKHITNPDSIKAYYPGSVGTLFDISDKLSQDLRMFVHNECSGFKKCLVNGLELTEDNIYELAPEGISLHASVYYRFGPFTIAFGNDVKAKCTDQIFKNEANVGNCISNSYNFYLAWNLKNNKDKFVKPGTYRQVANFYWQIDYVDARGTQISKKFGEDEAKAEIKLRQPYDAPARSLANKAMQLTSAIMLSNLYPYTKIELYNLQGKLIYSGNSGNSQTIKIPVQTRGIYIVKLSNKGSSNIIRVPAM